MQPLSGPVPLRRLITRHVCWRALGKGRVPLPRLGRMERCPCGKRDAREGGDGLGGEHRRGHSSALGSRLSALGSLSYAADNAAQNRRTHRLSSRQTTGRSGPWPSEPFSESSAHRGPDHDSTSVERCASARNPNFSRSGSVLLRHFPALNVSHSLCCPLKPCRATAPAPAAAGTLPALTPVFYGACVELRIPCRPLRRAAIRTRFPTRCRFGRRLTETQVPSSLAQYY